MNIKLDAPLRKHPIWDLPLRLFHWLLVASVGFAYVSGHLGGNLIEWHARAGFAIIGLVSFRLVWGLVGSPTARFSHFVRGPAAIRAYLRGEWRGVGHNPLGALSVTFLIPVFGVLWGVLLLGERLGGHLLLGGTLVLLGTALANGLLKWPRLARPA